MASNGNHPPTFNTNWPAALANACYQLAPQMHFNSFPPQPLCNIAGPLQTANSNPGYGSRVLTKRQLSQEVCHLRALLKQKRGVNSTLARDKRYLETQYAKLNDKLLEKDAELETLKQSKKSSRKSVRDAATQIQFDKCSKQCDRKTRALQENLDDIKVQKEEALHQIKRYKDKFERAQKEIEILMKKKLGEDSCKNHSSQIGELKRDNQKLKEENEVLENNIKADLDASKSRMENLQAELLQCKQKLSKVEGENRELKVTNEQILRESQQKLNQMTSQNKANAKEFGKLSEVVAGLKVELDRQVKDHSLQLSELNDKNKNLEEENEILKANARADFDCATQLDTSTSMIQKLQTELDNREAELRQYTERLEKAEEENNQMKNENKKLNQDLDDFEDIVNQNAKDILRLKNSSDNTEQFKSDLDTCRAQLESCTADLQKEREDKNGIVEERDRLKADLTKAKESIEISVERCAKLGIKLNRLEDKCKEYVATIDKLKQDFAQSQTLKADLESAKTANDRLSSMNKELQKEAQRLWKKVFVGSNDGQGSCEVRNDGNCGPIAPKKKKPNPK